MESILSAQNVVKSYKLGSGDLLTVLDHVSYEFPKGKLIMIMGRSGSGKTTLMNALSTLDEVTEGEILLDGVDIRKMSLDSLRGKVGYVPQKAMLFSGTIASNLRFGDEEAGEEELKEAAEIAQAMEIINETPEGMERQVAQGGTNVSGGQQQRLSIARALVKKAPIYLFDDSFSALDFRTDRALRNALKEKIGDRTFIIVAQRINTIMDADQIIVLNSGRVAGIGTHHQLLEDCQVYKEIAQSQLSEEELRKEGI